MMKDATINNSLTVDIDPAEDIRSVLRWEEKRMGSVSRGVLKQALVNVEKLQSAALIRERDEARAVLPCGHHHSLLLYGAENGKPLYCELCDAVSRRNAAERVEIDALAKVEQSAQDTLRLITTIKYLRGIAERGEKREISEDETIEQFVLGYVKRLEAEVERLIAEREELADLVSRSEKELTVAEACVMYMDANRRMRAAEAEVEQWRTHLSAVMPADFKDWHQNSPAEWPEIAAGAITSLREREAFAWAEVERLRLCLLRAIEMSEEAWPDLTFRERAMLKPTIDEWRDAARKEEA